VVALLRVRRQPPKLDEQTAEQLAQRAPTLRPPAADEDAPDGERIAGAPAVEEAAPSVREAPEAPAPEAVAPLSPRERFRLRLGRARGGLGARVAAILRGGIDDDVWDEIEDSLISADVGVEA